MTVPPEIEKLREQAWSRKPLSKADEHALAVDPDRFTYVSIRDAEAAVLACEKRMAAHAAEVLARERDRTIAATRRATAAEIVGWARELPGTVDVRETPSPLSPSAGEWAADLIKQRFLSEGSSDDRPA